MKHVYIIIAFAAILGLATSCKSAQSASTTTKTAVTTSVDDINYLRKITDNNQYAQNITSKVKFNAGVGGQNVSLSGNLKMRRDDVIQISYGYGLFTGGLGIQYAAERLGALTVPAGAGNSKRHVKFITDFGTTALHCIPSYATRLAAAFEEEGINPRDTTVKTLIIGAEPHSEAQRRRIEEIWGAKAYNNFGMSEMCGPGVAIECQEQNGMHIWEDNYIVEILDPETLEPVPEGELGELVLTTLNREAMPLFRYRTRDLTRIIPGDCPCGRTHRRLDRFQGRSDDRMIIKGVNTYPIQIEKILMQFPELASDYLITIETIGDNDEMTIEAELKQATDDFAMLQNLTREITRRLKDEILLTPKVKLVGKGVIPQSDGKAKRVVDLRQNH